MITAGRRMGRDDQKCQGQRLRSVLCLLVLLCLKLAGTVCGESNIPKKLWTEH